MAQATDIMGKLSESQKTAVNRNPPSKVLGKKDLEDLLHFGFFSQGQTTKGSRLEVRAILLAAVSNGMPLDVAKSLKETLRESPTERTKNLLTDINNPNMTTKSALSKFLTEKQVGAKLTAIDPTTLPGVKIEDGTTINVSPVTMQNLDVAHSINFAVKSIITDGAPNQAPDVVRTDGRNFLVLGDQGLGQHVNNLLGNDNQHQYDLRRANLVDKQIGAPNHGEEYGNIIEKSQFTAIIGSGKCGEHAATSFALLTDPKSLLKLGVEIPDGSTVILALGDKIDHNYVLIAGPGSVEFEDDGPKRRLKVKDPNSVVVVDPWMPIPTAHTLSRCNHDIQVDPECKMAVVMKGGEPHVLGRNGSETAIPKGDVSTLDQLNRLKEKYHPTVLKKADKEGIVPKSKQESLALACGRLEIAVLGMGKPGPYESSHLSTNTPKDIYQCVDRPKDPDGIKVGTPVSYFAANQQALKSTHKCIGIVQKTSIEDMAFDRENLKLMPKDMREGLEHCRKVKENKKAVAEKIPEPVVNRYEPAAEGEKHVASKPTALISDPQMKDVAQSKLGEPKDNIQQKVETGKSSTHRYDSVKEIVAQIEKNESQPPQEHGVKAKVQPFSL